jgi:hypothetical protein
MESIDVKLTYFQKITRTALSAVTALFAVMSGSHAQSAVWENQSDWTPEWEARFQEWVDREWEPNFFVRSGWYKDVQLDCADAVYAMRLVYAAENRLPFAIKDPTGGKKLITNQMSRWDDLPEEQKKRKFLLYVVGLVSTGSLPNDSYPVAANRNEITSGRFLLSDKASHHSWTVKSVSEVGIPVLVFATQPASSYMYDRYEFPTVDFLFPNGLAPERHVGFRGFRKPEDILKPVWEVPGYSLEQYQLPEATWVKAMQKRLQIVEETADGRLKRIMVAACKGAKERVTVVSRGWAELGKIGFSCMSPRQYDDYSTPGRDERMRGTFRELYSAYADAVKSGAPLSPQVQQQAYDIIAYRPGREVRTAVTPYCPLEVIPGVVMSMGQVYYNSLSNRLSDDPHDTREARWGLAPYPGELAARCFEGEG